METITEKGFSALDKPVINSDDTLQLNIAARDSNFCNRLLGELRREGVKVAAQVFSPAQPPAVTDCDLWLLLADDNTAAFLDQFNKAGIVVPLVIATTGTTNLVTGPGNFTVIPVTDFPSFVQHLKLQLYLQGERRRSRRLDRQLQVLEEQRLHLAKSSQVALALLKNHHILFCNSSFAALFGNPEPATLQHTSLIDLVCAADRPALDKLLRLSGTGDKPLTLTPAEATKTGSFQMRLSPSSHQGTACLLAEALPNRPGTTKGSRQSRPGKDLITRLDNLPCFTTRVESAITAAINNGTSSMLLVARIDQFRRVQETIGKAATGQVLADIAGFLKSAISKPYTATRLDTDEFGVLLYDSTPREAARLAAFINSRVNVSLLPPTAEAIDLSASIGIAAINRHSRDADEVIGRARINTGNRQKHGQSQTHDPAIADAMPAGIRNALAAERFTLRFQPVVALRSPVVPCYEVAFQLFGSDGSEFPRDLVMACANMHDLGTEIDRKLLSCLLAKTHRPETGMVTYQVALSSNALVDADFPGWLSEQLRHLRFPADHLTFLVSEIDLHSNREQVRSFCASLDELGIPFILADFGGAMDPLPALSLLKPAGVRLDTLLVRDLLYSRQQQQAFGKLIDAIHHQRAMVTAAGLEDNQLLPLLYELGVDHIQGNCLQSPQPEPRFDFPVERAICAAG